MATAVVMVVTLMSPTQAAPVEAGPDPEFESKILPSVESTPWELPTPTVPEGDYDTVVAPISDHEGAGAVAPNAFAFEDLDSAQVLARDEYSTTYDVGDGVRVVELSEIPLNVRVDGEWVAASNAVTAADDGWVAERHPLLPRFADSAGDGPQYSIQRDGFEVTFRLTGTDDVAGWRDHIGRAQPGPVTYRDVIDGSVDLVYEVEPGGVKESLVLEEPPSGRSPIYQWVIEAPGLEIVEVEDGSFVFVDEDGNVPFFIPAPVMWDSSGVDEVREPEVLPVNAGVSRDGDVWRLTIWPDREWLEDPDRVYPVYIDPSTWNSGPSSQKSYKSDGATFTATTHIGNPVQSNGSIWRGFNQFGLSALAGKLAIGAAYGVQYAGSGTTTCRSGSISAATVSNPTAYSHGGGTALSTFSNLCGGSTWVWASSGINDGLDTTVAGWIDAGTYTKWFALRGQETAGVYTYKKVNTSLLVSYTSMPTVTGVTGSTPTGGATGPVRPIMVIAGSRVARCAPARGSRVVTPRWRVGTGC